MKAKVINVKAIRFMDTDNEEHTVLVKNIEELRIERYGKRLTYCIGLPYCPCLIEIDKDTYNIFFESIEKYLGSCTEKIEIESEQNISKKIEFKDLGAWEQTVLPKNIEGLSVEQYEGKLEYFVNISNKGYGTEVDFKTFNILLAALKAVANVKEKDNDKSKEKREKNKSKAFEIEFDDGCGGTCSFNPDELWQVDLTKINSIYYKLRLFDKSDILICEALITWELWQKLNLEKIIKENRNIMPKKYRTTMVKFLDINNKVHNKPLSELKSIAEEIDHGKPKFKVEFNTGSQFYVNKENFNFFVKMFE